MRRRPAGPGASIAISRPGSPFRRLTLSDTTIRTKSSVVPYWGYGYGFGHGGVGVLGIILIVLVVLLLMGRL